MRYSVIGFFGTALVGMMVGCGDDATDAPSGDTGAAAGAAGNAGIGGTKASGGKGGAAAGKGGSATAGSNNGTGGSAKGGSSNGTGGAATGGSANGTGGSHSAMGGSSTTGGKGGSTGGTDTGMGGTTIEPSTGGGSGEAGAGGADAGASGADNGGMAGASTSSGGAGSGQGGASSCSSGVACGASCLDPSAGTLDQSQYIQNGTIVLSVQQMPGQSFTVGTSGFLTGIETTIANCNADTAAAIQLDVFDNQATNLGHVALPVSSLAQNCDPGTLAADSIGAGHFDLTPLCLSASAGDQYTFVLSMVGGSTGTCDRGTFQCTNSGDYCDFDSDCSGWLNVGITNCGGTGCDSSQFGGNAVVVFSGSSTIQQQSGFELPFKTFMQ